MNLNISREWLLRMAEKEANGIISVGGFFYREDAMTRQTHAATVVPAFDAPHDVRPIVEAPPDVEALFTRWSAADFPWQLEHELAGALQPHRGVRLLTPLYVVWLTKSSDRNDDEVCVAPRSWPLRLTFLPMREERTPC